MINWSPPKQDSFRSQNITIKVDLAHIYKMWPFNQVLHKCVRWRTKIVQKYPFLKMTDLTP